MDKNSTILIVGHNDITEVSLFHALRAKGYKNVYSASAICLNTAIQPAVYEFFQRRRPEYVFLGSTRSGGIAANQRNAAEYIYHNMESQNNILYAAHKFGVKKLLYIASSCVYPKDCQQPIKEEYLLTGALEETSAPYATAKVAGIKLCQSFNRNYGLKAIAMVPATVYGPGGDFDAEVSHVIDALIAKFAEAVKHHKKEVTVWGTGRPMREFLYSEDFVDACLYLMKHYNGRDIVNVGFGRDIPIEDLAVMINRISGFDGNMFFDDSKPDGVMKKLLDSGRMTKLGWKPKVDLKAGITKTFQWYLNQYID